MKIIQISALILLGYIPTGRSASLPSEADANSALRALVTQQSNGLISLSSFTKTNGREIPQAQAYVLEFAGTIKFEDDCMYGDPPSGNRPFKANRNIPKTPTDEMLAFGMGRGRKGQMVRIHGEFDYENTEKGWRVANYQIVFGEAIAAPPQSEGSHPQTTGPAEATITKERIVGTWRLDSHDVTSVETFNQDGTVVDVTNGKRTEGTYSFRGAILICQMTIQDGGPIRAPPTILQVKALEQNKLIATNPKGREFSWTRTE